jgi:hypothetical protein
MQLRRFMSTLRSTVITNIFVLVQAVSPPDRVAVILKG